MTVVKGKNDELPRTEGRHNTYNLVEYFASVTFPSGPADITFRNCAVDNIHAVLHYYADNVRMLHSGAHLTSVTLENVRFTDLKGASRPQASSEEPLTVTLKNVTAEFTDEAPIKQLFNLGECRNTTVIEE
jgi:hypothetical protein